MNSFFYHIGYHLLEYSLIISNFLMIDLNFSFSCYFLPNYLIILQNYCYQNNCWYLHYSNVQCCWCSLLNSLTQLSYLISLNRFNILDLRHLDLIHNDPHFRLLNANYFTIILHLSNLSCFLLLHYYVNTIMFPLIEQDMFFHALQFAIKKFYPAFEMSLSLNPKPH